MAEVYGDPLTFLHAHRKALVEIIKIDAVKIVEEIVPDVLYMNRRGSRR